MSPTRHILSRHITESKSFSLVNTKNIPQIRIKTELSAMGGSMNDRVTVLFRILASISFVTSLLGLSFQIFVLYPWHEELSYEFKTLEEAIIRLDRTLEVTNPTMTEEQLKRLTDKYTLKPNVDKAGPKISDYIKILSDEELKVIKSGK